MQLYDVLLVNPLADGMNLVAKEGVLVNQKDGVLILSENAGAYFELKEGAIVVSPFDIFGTAEALHQALTMDPAEKHKRAATLRRHVEGSGVTQWFTNQVEDALAALESQSSSASTSVTPDR